MTIVPISPSTDEKLNRLSAFLNKKRRIIIQEALRYGIKKRLGGDTDGTSPIGQDRNRIQYREHDQ